jgi:hypothetical protein
LKVAVEKHNRNEDPVPYLLNLLKNNDNNLMQWKILAQICSYVVLFHNNLEDGVKYFKLLVEAVQNEFASEDLILVRNHLEIFNLNFGSVKIIYPKVTITSSNIHLPDIKYFNLQIQLLITTLIIINTM